MEFDVAKKNVIEYLSKNLAGNQELANFYYTILNHISLLEDDKEVPEYNRQFIIEVIHALGTSLLENPLDSELCTFLDSLIEIVYNWNVYVLKDNMVSLVCRLIKMQIESIIAIKKSVKVIKEAEDRFKTLESWLPAAYDISEEYLDELFKEE